MYFIRLIHLKSVNKEVEVPEKSELSSRDSGVEWWIQFQISCELYL